MELSFFVPGNIAFSEPQIALEMCFLVSHCNIVTNSMRCRERKIELQKYRHTAQKWSLSLRVSSANINKPAVSCGFGHIYWRNPQWKTSYFIQWYRNMWGEKHHFPPTALPPSCVSFWYFFGNPLPYFPNYALFEWRTFNQD